MSTLSLRPAMPDDAAVLQAVYADTRSVEVAAFGWSDEQAHAFIEMQYRALTADRASRHPLAEHSVIVLDGTDVGSMSVDRSGAAIELLDIAVFASHRGRGIGTRLLQRLADEADRLGARIDLHAAEGSPVLGLYARCGFAVRDGDGMYVRMARALRAAVA